MSSCQMAQAILQEIQKLCLVGNCGDWAQTIGQVRKDLGADWSIARSQLMGLFGGMGSLSDLVLQRNGKVLVRETEELNALLDRLYDLCHTTANAVVTTQEGGELM